MLCSTSVLLTPPPHYAPHWSEAVGFSHPHLSLHFSVPLSWMFSPDHTRHTAASDQSRASKPELKELSLMLPLHCFLISQHFSSNGSREQSAAPSLTFPLSSSRTPQLSARARCPRKNPARDDQTGTVSRWESKATEKRSTFPPPVPCFQQHNRSLLYKPLKLPIFKYLV